LWKGVDWINLTEDKDQRLAVAITEMKIRFP
jgi:hypothetical protein